MLTVFDLFHETLSKPAYRGCPFTNAAAEYPHHEGIQAVIEYHRSWLPGLFSRLLRPLGAPGDLVAGLVQLCDGAMTAAHLDHSGTSAKTARDCRAAAGGPAAVTRLTAAGRREGEWVRLVAVRLRPGGRLRHSRRTICGRFADGLRSF
ncbi:hypothetical protein [Streptomyces vietnamensis]|uniref:hypothetical protein n=1 Tax=Streptomyces vietnamensis TaxID=362257 RepID=UPI00069823B0